MERRIETWLRNYKVLDLTNNKDAALIVVAITTQHLYDNANFGLQQLMGKYFQSTQRRQFIYNITFTDKEITLFMEDFKVRFLRYYYLIVNSNSREVKKSREGEIINKDDLLYMAMHLALYDFRDFRVCQYFWSDKLFDVNVLKSAIRILEGDILLI